MRAADEDDDEEMDVRSHRLSSIISNITKNRHRTDYNAPIDATTLYTGDTTTNGDSDPVLKPRKRRLPAMNGRDRDTTEYNNNNNIINNINSINNTQGSPGAVKNERLSPGTPDTLSRSRSVTPSSASYPGTPPAAEVPHPALPLGRNYSDFMRSLAAKYNNANPNDYFSNTVRNGYPLLKPHSAHSYSSSPPSPPTNKPKPHPPADLSLAAALLNPFASPSPFPPLIDMSSTHALLAMVRTAKEAEVQNLLKTSPKRSHSGDEGGRSVTGSGGQGPLDLSAQVAKRVRGSDRQGKEERKMDGGVQQGVQGLQQGIQGLQQQIHGQDSDITNWTVDDVCSFVASIDICAEYAVKFREQRIDGSGLPLLTEEHLTSTMGLKLGPALKLRSLLARKTGSCSVCLHCVHCHTSSASTTSSAAGDMGQDGST